MYSGLDNVGGWCQGQVSAGSFKIENMRGRAGERGRGCREKVTGIVCGSVEQSWSWGWTGVSHARGVDFHTKEQKEERKLGVRPHSYIILDK